MWILNTSFILVWCIIDSKLFVSEVPILTCYTQDVSGISPTSCSHLSHLNSTPWWWGWEMAQSPWTPREGAVDWGWFGNLPKPCGKGSGLTLLSSSFQAWQSCIPRAPISSMWGTTPVWAPNATWPPKFSMKLSRWIVLTLTRESIFGPLDLSCGRWPGGW